MADAEAKKIERGSISVKTLPSMERSRPLSNGSYGQTTKLQRSRSRSPNWREPREPRDRDRRYERVSGSQLIVIDILNHCQYTFFSIRPHHLSCLDPEDLPVRVKNKKND